MLEYMPVMTACMCAMMKGINVEVAMNTAVQLHGIRNLGLLSGSDHDLVVVVVTATK
jgi:hypothetical protein